MFDFSYSNPMDTLNAYLLHARRVGGIYRVCGYRRMHHACPTQ